jgi:hypothetical protein
MNPSGGEAVSEYEAPAILERREIIGSLQVGSPGGEPTETETF